MNKGWKITILGFAIEFFMVSLNYYLGLLNIRNATYNLEIFIVTLAGVVVVLIGTLMIQKDLRLNSEKASDTKVLNLQNVEIAIRKKWLRLNWKKR